AKEIMNLYTWTIGASHTPAAFLATALAALPFDITDMIATLLFALAFGPRLARLLARTRERMTVSWEAFPSKPSPPASRSPKPLAPAILVLVAVAAFALGGRTLARASTSSPDGASPAASTASTVSTASIAHLASLSPALSFLVSAQNSDGGFGAARGQGSSELYTAWAAMGLAATGHDPANVRHGGHSVLDSLRAGAATLQGLGDAERTILAVHACGASAYAFAGHDLVAEGRGAP